MLYKDDPQAYIELNFKNGFALDNKTQLVIDMRTTDAYPHTHNFFELMYVARGSVVHSINFAKPIVMKKRDFVLIDLDSVHEYASVDKNGCEVINVAFLASFIDNRLSSKSKLSNIFRSSKLGLSGKNAIAPAGIIMHDVHSDILDIIELISKELKKADDISTNIIRHLLITLLISITRMSNIENMNDLSELSALMINYIEKHYAEQNLLNSASDEFNYSAAYLSNKFHLEVGVPFNNYLQNYRIEMAKHLLNTTKMSVSEIANAVGYSDGKYFALIFKRLTGMNPSYYKKTIIKYLPDASTHI